MPFDIEVRSHYNGGKGIRLWTSAILNVDELKFLVSVRLVYVRVIGDTYWRSSSKGAEIISLYLKPLISQFHARTDNATRGVKPVLFSPKGRILIVNRRL
jgi:hypothetical protein